MWPRDGTVLTVSSRALVEACARLGIDTEAMLRMTGVRREMLEDPDARLPNGVAGALWAKAYELSRDPVLSLHVAETCPLGAYRVIDYVLSTAPTIGDMLRVGARYVQLLNSGIAISVDDSGDPVAFDLSAVSAGDALSRPFAEFCLAIFVLHVRAAAGAMRLRQVTFTHPRPADTSEHERVFGCPVQFEAAHNRLVIERSDWDAPTRGAQDPGLFAVLTEHAELLLSTLPRAPDIVERTRRAIGARLRAGDASLEGVARELATSGRTLQRQLRELGYSYAALVDEVRQAMAQAYMEQPDISLAEVGYLLGFAAQSAFIRAFKRWNGCTPKQARARGMFGSSETASRVR